MRREAEIATMAVGLILHPQQAEDVLVQGQADLIGIGREALFDPNWPQHARLALTEANGEVFGDWPEHGHGHEHEQAEDHDDRPQRESVGAAVHAQRACRFWRRRLRRQ